MDTSLIESSTVSIIIFVNETQSHCILHCNLQKKKKSLQNANLR